MCTAQHADRDAAGHVLQQALTRNGIHLGLCDGPKLFQVILASQKRSIKAWQCT
jgi:hypothetical protein